MNTNIKPLSTTTPEAIAAANKVTPERLSDLLLDKGPLAIRYITKELSVSIPCFKDLSTSKQRRLIMSAMETGDVKNNRLFEKIGWGQWSIKVVPSEEFESQRKLVNLHNLEVKLSHQSSNSRKSTSEESQTDKIIYIDENAIHSDDGDDHGDDDTEKVDNTTDQSNQNKIIKATVHYPRKRLHSFSTFERPVLFDQSNKRTRRGSAIVYTSHDEFISTNNLATEPDKSPRLSYILHQQPVIMPITPRKLSYSASTSVESSIRSTLPSDDVASTGIANYHFNKASPTVHNSNNKNNKSGSESASPPIHNSNNNNKSGSEWCISTYPQ